MKTLNYFAATAAASILAATGAVAAVDTVEAPTGFFVPSLGLETTSPYYRGFGQDWGWMHGAITDPFTSATLNISAYDVDEESGEVDNIYAYDGETRVLLGSLTGEDDAFSFTEFVLGPEFFDDIMTGLKVEIEIDVATQGFWLVSLGKSVLTTDGSGPGNPNPGIVPLPAAGWLMIAGIGGLAALRRKKA